MATFADIPLSSNTTKKELTWEADGEAHEGQFLVLAAGEEVEGGVEVVAVPEQMGVAVPSVRNSKRGPVRPLQWQPSQR